MPKKYHIRDLEEVTGIKAHTIRIWEKRYNLIEPERSETNIRYYDEATFKKFLLITKLYYSDVKISDISKLSLEEMQEKVTFLHPVEAEFETWATDLLLAVINFDNFQFEKILKDSSFSFNLDKTFSLFLIPFVHKIETLWNSNSITLLHKQFAFENIKRFLYNISYSVVTNYPKGENRIVLVADNEEFNAFILLYADIVLRKKNYDVIFLNKIDDLRLFFDDIADFNVFKAITVASQNPEKAEKVIKNIKKHKKVLFYLIDLKFYFDLDFKNLILINNLEELESEL